VNSQAGMPALRRTPPRNANILVCGFWRLSGRQFHIPDRQQRNTGLESPVNSQAGMPALRRTPPRGANILVCGFWRLSSRQLALPAVQRCERITAYPQRRALLGPQSARRPRAQPAAQLANDAGTTLSFSPGEKARMRADFFSHHRLYVPPTRRISPTPSFSLTTITGKPVIGV
jgi:hypothetical protein